MGLFEKQIPKYIESMEGPAVEPVVVDDIFDPLFNEEVRSMLEQKYGSAIALNGYKELLNNVWVENDGAFGKGMGLLSAFGRSMEKADDLILGAATEAVEGLTGQGFDNPLKQIFVEDEDYTGRRFLAAAANSMRGFADGTTLTEEDFGPEWGLPALGIDLISDVGILGSGLSKTYAPHLTQGAQRVSSGEIFRNLGKSGNAKTTIGEIGQLMSDYDDLMAKVAIDVTAPGLRFALKGLMNRIATHIGAASYRDYADYTMHRGAPDTGFEAGPSTKADGADFKTGNGTPPPEPQDDMVAGLTTLYENVRRAYESTPETTAEMVQRAARTPAEISEEVMTSPSWYVNDLLDRRRDARNEMLADVVRQYLNNTSQNRVQPQTRYVAHRKNPVVDAAPSESPIENIDERVRDTVVALISQGVDRIDAASVGLWMQQKLSKGIVPTAEEIAQKLSKIEDNISSTFRADVHRGAGSGTYTRQGNVDGTEDDGGDRSESYETPERVRQHIRYTLGDGRSMADRVVHELTPALANVSKIKLDLNTKFSEQFRQMQERAAEMGVVIEDLNADQGMAHAMDPVRRIVEDYYKSLESSKNKYFEVSESDLEEVRNALIAEYYRDPKNNALGRDFEINGKAIDDVWGTDDWITFAQRIAERDWDFQSTVSFLEGYSSQRDVHRFNLKNSKWHVSTSERAIFGQPGMSDVYVALNRMVQSLKYPMYDVHNRTPLFSTRESFREFMRNERMTTVLYNLFERGGFDDVSGRLNTKGENLRVVDGKITKFIEKLEDVLFSPTTDMYETFKKVDALVAFLDYNDLFKLSEQRYNALRQRCPEELAYIEYVDSIMDRIGEQFIARVRGWGIPNETGFLPADRPTRSKYRYPKKTGQEWVDAVSDDYSESFTPMLKAYMSKLAEHDLLIDSMAYVSEPIKDFVQIGLNDDYALTGVDLENANFFINELLPKIENLMRLGGNPFNLKYCPKYFKKEDFQFLKKYLDPKESLDRTYRKMLESVMLNPKHNLAPLSKDLPDNPSLKWLRSVGDPRVPKAKRPVPVTIYDEKKKAFETISPDAPLHFKAVVPSKFDDKFQNLRDRLVPHVWRVSETDADPSKQEQFRGSVLDVWKTAKQRLYDALNTLKMPEEELEKLLYRFNNPYARVKLTPEELRAVYYYSQVYTDSVKSLPYQVIQTDAMLYATDPQRFVRKHLVPKLPVQTPDMSDEMFERLMDEYDQEFADYDDFITTMFESGDPLYSEALYDIAKRFVSNAPPQIANAWTPSVEKGIFNFNLSPQSTPYYITLGETLPLFSYDAQIVSRYGMPTGSALTAAKKNPYLIQTKKGESEFARYLGALDYAKLMDDNILNKLAHISANVKIGMSYIDTRLSDPKAPDEFFNELRERYKSNKVARRNLIRHQELAEQKPVSTTTTAAPAKPVPDADDAITRFRDDYAFLSNMYACPVTYNGLTFRNVEAAFQAQKDPSRAHEFVSLTGAQAKKLGKTVTLRNDWESVKRSIMTEICQAKFTQHPELMDALRLTGSRELVEGNTWGDTYWGVVYSSKSGEPRGDNNLGKILMDIRRANPAPRSHAVQETSEAIENAVAHYESAPVEEIIEAIENPEATSTAEAVFDRIVAEYCPEIKESMDSGATAEQAEEMFHESWNLFRQISNARAVRSRNAEGDYASLRHPEVRLMVNKVRAFMLSNPKFTYPDYHAYYTLKSRQAGDVILDTDFWTELRRAGMLTTCLPTNSPKIPKLKAVLQRNADRLNEVLGDEYFVIDVHPTRGPRSGESSEMSVVTIRFAKGKYDVCEKIDKYRKKVDAINFETVAWAEPEELALNEQMWLTSTVCKQLDSLEQEVASLTQEFYKLLGFTFDDLDYSRHVMNRNDDTMMFLQNNFYRDIPSEDLDDIVDQLSILYNDRGTFGTKLYGRRYRGHYWNLEKDGPNLFSYNPLTRVKSSLSNGALANNQLQTYIDLFFNDNFAIKEWFQSIDDLKKVLYAEGPTGRSGNFENLKLVTYKLDSTGKIVGIREFNKATDKGLQEALDTPGTILVPSETVTHLDHILKRERKMSNKLWTFANKLTGAFKLGVLMNPGFLIGNASDAVFKTITAMSEKYGTSFEEEAANFAKSVREVVALENNFVDAFEEYLRVLNSSGIHISPEETIPDIVAMSPRHSKTFEKWLNGELTHTVSEKFGDETVSHEYTVECTLTKTVKDRVRYWMELQHMQMDSSKMREMGEIAGVFKRSKYAYNRGIDRVFSGTGQYSASDVKTWGLFANPAVKAVTDSSEWIEEIARTAAIHDDLRHSGYAPGHEHKRTKKSANAHSFDERDVAYENAMNTAYSAHFNYEDTPDFMDGLADFIPFPIFFLKNFYFWMELFLNNPQFVDNAIDIQEGLWAHRSEEEDDEFARAAKGRGAIPVGDGDGQGLSNFFKGYYKPTPMQSMFGAFSLLNDPIGDVQYRLHPALTGGLSAVHSAAPNTLTTLLDPEENMKYRPYSTNPYERNLKPGDPEYNPLEFAVHRANPVERATQSHIRIPGKAEQGTLQVADFFPSVFQPEY